MKNPNPNPMLVLMMRCAEPIRKRMIRLFFVDVPMMLDVLKAGGADGNVLFAIVSC